MHTTAIRKTLALLDAGKHREFRDDVIGMNNLQLQKLETALHSTTHPIAPQVRDWALALVNETLDTLSECG